MENMRINKRDMGFGIDKPKVSVIVPIYNNDKYLDRCLDSIITDIEGY